MSRRIYESDPHFAPSLWRQIIRISSKPFANLLGLTRLPEHADTLVLSTAVFYVIYTILSPLLSQWLFKKSYGRFKRDRDRKNWNANVVALVHATIIVPLAFSCLDIDQLNKDRAFAWDHRTGTLGAIALGYFIWDTCVSLSNSEDLGIIIHALACMLIYLFGFAPFLPYYGTRFLLWEVSTPFLKIHWFMDKVGLTGSMAQLLNGIILCTTFAGSRLVYGTIMSYQFFKTMFDIRDEIPLIIFLLYTVGNVALNVLNWYWFLKMIDALQRRMDPEARGGSERKQQ